MASQSDHHPETQPGADEQSLQNLHVARTLALTSPAELTERMPVSPTARGTVVEGRRAICRILDQQDPRMLAIVGPCSIHDPDAAVQYADRLTRLRRDLGDRLEVVMRVYFEKPRTTTGWKGLINDPHLNGSFDMHEGLERARRLLGDIAGMGLPTATEVLDPIVPQYLDDLICWASIGARTTESQTHRQMASGLSMPVGFKNSTEGNLQVAVDAMKAARSPHAFLGLDEYGKVAVVHTRGNPWGHIVLRGGRERSNYADDDVAGAAAMLQDAGLPTRLMVDCSHANSGKKPEKQQVAWRSVVEQRGAGNAHLIGLMLESNLHEGRQDLTDDPADLKPGVSITDACIGWEETEDLLRWAHEQLG